jgi:putative component of toxin-antitoxin plasmid stabilization module
MSQTASKKVKKTKEFVEWQSSLKDAIAKSVIDARIKRLQFQLQAKAKAEAEPVAAASTGRSKGVKR